MSDAACYDVDMRFSAMLDRLSPEFGLSTCCVRRPKWSSGVVLDVMVCERDSEMSTPYLYIDDNGLRSPWAPSQDDLFAGDWLIIEGE